jgi:putative DNA primase/helicase
MTVKRARGTLQRLSDPALERTVLGCVLMERAIPEPLLSLAPSDFYDTLHGAIFAAMRTLHDQGHAVDETLLLGQLEKAGALGDLNHAGGVAYFVELFDLHPTPTEAATYARRILDLAGKRKLWIETQSFMTDLLNGKLEDLSADSLRTHHIALLEGLDISSPTRRVATWADLDGVIGPVAWDWHGWIPRGFLTILAGETGVGKSILALRLCACYLRGDDWPDGRKYSGEPGQILWCEAEAAQVLNWERALSWALPREKILVPLGVLEDVQIDDPEHRRAMAYIADRPEVRFVVVDSFSGASRRDENSSESMAAVKWLAALARDTGKPILLLHHLRKRGILDSDQKVSLERLRGHSSIVQPARLVLALDTPNPNREDTKRLSVIKSNLAPFPAPLGLRVTERGQVMFCQAPKPPQAMTLIDQAVEALKALLSGGPVPYDELMEDLQDIGISERTARRAKAALGVVSRKKRDGWTWGLPSDLTPPPY